MLLFPWCRIISNLQFSFTSIPPPATTQNGRVAGLVVIRFHFPKNIPKSLTSNPLSQIATSNPRLQPDTHFTVDMFPYKKTELFQKSGFKSKPPKKPGNTPLSGTWFYFLDINTTVSTCLGAIGLMSSVHPKKSWAKYVEPKISWLHFCFHYHKTWIFQETRYRQ